MEPEGERLRLDDPEIPPEPGVYVVYSDAPIGDLNWNPTQGPAYVGKAENGLRSRISRVHLSDTGRSTLRRSYGALLKDELGLRTFPRPRGGPPEAIDYTNYTFSRPGDDLLTDWMKEHLRISSIPKKQPESEETRLIDELAPPLNLTGWDNPWRTEIKALRAACADEARAFGEMWSYSMLTGERLPRAKSPEHDLTDHGRWVSHSIVRGWRGRISYRLVETGELTVVWEESSYGGSAVNPSMFKTFDPGELLMLDEPPEPWLPLDP